MLSKVQLIEYNIVLHVFYFKDILILNSSQLSQG